MPVGIHVTNWIKKGKRITKTRTRTRIRRQKTPKGKKRLNFKPLNQSPITKFCEFKSKEKGKESEDSSDNSQDSQGFVTAENSNSKEAVDPILTQTTQTVSPFASPLSKLELASKELRNSLKTIDPNVSSASSQEANMSAIQKSADNGNVNSGEVSNMMLHNNQEPVNINTMLNPSLRSILPLHDEMARRLQQNHHPNTDVSNVMMGSTMLGNAGIYMSQHQPQSMNVDTVYTMFDELKKKIEELSKEMKTLTQGKKIIDEKMDGFQFEQERTEEELLRMKEDFNKQQDSMEMLINTVSRQEEVINGLSERIIKMEKKSMSENVVITGIPEEENENCKQVFEDLMTDKNGHGRSKSESSTQAR